MNHFTIPVFIPMEGCRFDCVFCNQRQITGQQLLLDDDEIVTKIESYLETMPLGDNHVEIAFFGGSFTGLPFDRQKHYLELVQPWLKSKDVTGIRLSTRPDYIDSEVLQMLKLFGVTAIELGVQSMDEEVLRQSGRGHTAEHVRKAARMIKDARFSLGLQMMPGLPGDTLEKSLESAREIVALEADATRIYPTLVITHTHLEKLYKQGQYKPLTLDEAIERCSSIVPLFERAGVKILRLGLHASEGMLTGEDLVAGPFHVAFGEMVYSRIWYYVLKEITPDPTSGITFFVNPEQLNQAIGHKALNRKMLEKRFLNVAFKPDESLKNRDFHYSTKQFHIP
jgi:histone acetyltransferase (RNA polymerase elongator complex component)